MKRKWLKSLERDSKVGGGSLANQFIGSQARLRANGSLPVELRPSHPDRIRAATRFSRCQDRGDADYQPSAQ